MIKRSTAGVLAWGGLGIAVAGTSIQVHEVRRTLQGDGGRTFPASR